MKKTNKGFSLLELLLTISIVSIIMLTIFQSTNYGMHVFRRTNSNAELKIIKILYTLSRDLRSAFLMSQKHPSISFTGSGSSLKFVSVVPLDHSFDEQKEFDLKERRYFLTPGKEGRTRTLMYSTRSIGSQTASADKKKINGDLPLSSSIDSLTFDYFNGEKWLSSWNSQVQLPESVRVTVQFRENGQISPLGYFSTVILIPGT